MEIPIRPKLYSFHEAFNAVGRKLLCDWPDEGIEEINAQKCQSPKAIEKKAAKTNLEVNVRIVSAAPSAERDEAITTEIVHTFSQFASPDMNFFSQARESIKKIIYEFSFRLFDKKRMSVLSTE